MEQFYLDTSAILPYYREERLSQLIQNFLLSITPPVAISHLTDVEFASALSCLVRMEELDDAQAGIIEQTFADDCKAGLFKRISFTTSHFTQAVKWLSLRNTSLRTLDTLHLAVSNQGNLKIVTCDTILANSAEKLGADYKLLSE
ncbi:type II toxin-antitoxin system VapC family toxin [Desulfotalea psychrophila]|jgi:predicted nucleic acid-binding protein|uniref:Type II toxin-antitoxin system VapC family toxin n=1 Tax=Desulfotalea psychrophila TaxID=84980 RepID=A0ABS3AWP6_9BACT|nr:type II toxin-antitoxin system VapC family toxin [Desulfocapsa sp.]MBN4068312.1 type II toxin-antitoxin system VapC family toxin [Desulfotalea psychrophila]MBN4071579.1 type II toxin-antitoxin system VapC family toxin [Desulfotalea psychrophila]